MECIFLDIRNLIVFSETFRVCSETYTDNKFSRNLIRYVDISFQFPKCFAANRRLSMYTQSQNVQLRTKIKSRVFIWYSKKPLDFIILLEYTGSRFVFHLYYCSVWDAFRELKLPTISSITYWTKNNSFYELYYFPNLKPFQYYWKSLISSIRSWTVFDCEYNSIRAKW